MDETFTVTNNGPINMSEPVVTSIEVTPAQINTNNGSAQVQVTVAIQDDLSGINDAQALMAEPGDVQAHRVLDNLIYRREIPVMLGVFINPGRRPEQPEPNPRDWGDKTTNRTDEYHPPTDKYARVTLEELMLALKKSYNISPEPEHHAIMGLSSGGCAAFAVAWFRPDDFRKVISFVGNCANMRGEHIYPELVSASDHKPILTFMQDGRNDNRRSDNLNDAQEGGGVWDQ